MVAEGVVVERNLFSHDGEADRGNAYAGARCTELEGFGCQHSPIVSFDTRFGTEVHAMS